MSKRIISVILTFVFTLSSFGTFAAADTKIDEAAIIVNETFDDCIENGAHDTIDMQGIDARIVDMGEENKAIYSKLWVNGFLAEVPIVSTSERMVYSFDMLIKGGAVTGKVLNLSTSTTLFKFNSDKTITLEDGYPVGGYGSGKWCNYTAVIDYENACYDLYVGSRCIFTDRLFNTKPVTQSKMSFVFMPANEDEIAEIYIDNIRIYEGDKVYPESAFPKKALNTEAIEFEPTTEKPSNDKIYLNSSSRTGFETGALALQAKADTKVEWDTLTPSGGEVLKLEQTGTNDCFADVKIDAREAFSLVVEADVNVASMDNGTLDLFRTNGDGYSNLLTINKNGLVCNASSLGALPYNEWTNIAIACDFINGTGDVYINGALKKADIPLHSGGVRPSYTRIAFRSLSSVGLNKVYINNMKIYEGTEPRELPAVSTEENSDIAVDTSLHTMNLTSIQHSEATCKNRIGKDSVFMTLNNHYFMDGEKLQYAENMAAYKDENGIIMVPADLVAKAFDTQFKYQDGKIVAGSRTAEVGSLEVSQGRTLDAAPVEKDGVIFVPAASFTTQVLAKHAYEDDRGFVILSNNKLTYSNSSASTETMEKSDVIFRYMLYDRPSGDEIYDKVVSLTKGEHPRLLIRKDEIAALRAKVQSSDALKDALARNLVKCEAHINAEPYEYKLVGIRLIQACQDVTARIRDLAAANLVTGDDKYLDRMWLEIQNVLTWPDLNQDRHYLDTGEIAPGLALAYDMLYDYLTEAQRQHFRDEFERLLLDTAVGMFTGTSKYTANDTRQISSNWGAVIGGGLLMCALSFIDSEPEESEFTQKCKFLAENAVQTCEIPFGMLYPDGAIAEGQGYWTFYIESLGQATQSILNMCGDDYGFLDSPGYKEAANFPLYVQSQNGYYCYSSSGHTTGVGYWCACDETYLISKFYDNPEQMETLKAFNDSINRKIGSMGMLWYEPSDIEVDVSSYPLDNVFNGMQLGTMKASWGDDAAAFLSTIGGELHPSNAHWHAGSFIYEDDGNRWFHDPGSENYDLPGGTHGMDGATLYMKRAEGHNCIVINPTADDPGQVTWEYAPIIKMESKPKGGIIVYDLDAVYAHQAKSYKRGFYFGDNRNSLVVQDELELLKDNSDVYHFLTTTGKVTIGDDGKTAYIKEDGMTMKIEYICDADKWHLEARDASSLTPEIAREGEHSRAHLQKVALVAKDSGKLNISIKATVVDELETYSPHNFVPMDQWTLPDGEVPKKPSLTSISVNGQPIADFNPTISEYSISLTADTPIPTFTATSDDGTIEVIAPATLNDVARIIVSNEGGKRAYKVKFNFIIREYEALIDTKPVKEVPTDVIKPEAVWVYASHNPQPENCDINAADGKMDTRWSSNIANNFLEFDLGETKALDGIAFAYMDSHRYYKYDILISDDKINYTKVYSGTSGAFATEWEYLPLAVKARYVRYVGHGHAEGEWNSIIEFRPCTKQ